jgi:A/G-specific adenine glycosylase
MNFQEKLINWYDHNKRDPPFRKSRDPYAIWISEIMLQQTTVTAVLPYYKRFMERFPNVKELAGSSLDEVYKYWEGLGYYRRAKYLLESAQMIVNDLNGVFPQTYEDLLKLKGVGPYTAAAISSFAYGAPQSAIDGNALRVLSRLFDLHDNIALAKTVKKITELSNNCIQGYDSAKYNQGFMDLANAICRVQNPDCTHCPLNKECLAYQNHEENILPINIKKIKKQEENFITGIITSGDKVMLIKNPADGLLENMYSLIQFHVESPFSFVEAFEETFDFPLTIESPVKDFKHVFTHRTWHMHVYHFVAKKPTDAFYSLSELKDLAIPTAHKKILTYYLQNK